MHHRLCAAAAVAMLATATQAAAQTSDISKYPDWSGQWRRPASVSPSWDPTKPPGAGPASAADAGISGDLRGSPAIRRRRAGHDPTATVPAARHAADDDRLRADGDRGHARRRPTILTDHIHELAAHLYRRTRLGRRISSRASPAIRSANGSTPTATAATTARGRDPRLQGPARVRRQRPAAAPRQPDVVKERIYLDKADPDLLHDEITVFDHALTRPWTVIKQYAREPERPNWL